MGTRPLLVSLGLKYQGICIPISHFLSINPCVTSVPKILSFCGSNKVLDFVFTNIKDRTII